MRISLIVGLTFVIALEAASTALAGSPCPTLAASTVVHPGFIGEFSGKIISQALFGGKVSAGAIKQYGSVNVFQMLYTLEDGRKVPGIHITYIGKFSQNGNLGRPKADIPRFWVKLNGQELSHDQLFEAICVGENCHRAASYVDTLDAEFGSIPFFDPEFSYSSATPLECQNQPTQAHLFDKALSASGQTLPSWDLQIAIKDMKSGQWDNNNDISHNYHVIFPGQLDLSHPKMTILAPPGPAHLPDWP